MATTFTLGPSEPQSNPTTCSWDQTKMWTDLGLQRLRYPDRGKAVVAYLAAHVDDLGNIQEISESDLRNLKVGIVNALGAKDIDITRTRLTTLGTQHNQIMRVEIFDRDAPESAPPAVLVDFACGPDGIVTVNPDKLKSLSKHATKHQKSQSSPDT
jgi:hypothetical protein